MSSIVQDHSGFINPLADVPNHFYHTNIALSKGWKLFKLKLKGLEMGIYKHPEDHSAEIEDLFPTVFVPARVTEFVLVSGSLMELTSLSTYHVVTLLPADLTALFALFPRNFTKR